MKLQIDSTKFGSITIEGEKIKHDVIIRLDGKIKKRKKKLSKAISQDEAQYVYQKGAEKLIIGTGQYDTVKLSDEAEKYFKQKHCRVKLLSTPKAVSAWNKAKGAVIGLFHVTC